MIVIGFRGAAGSGKDSAANFLATRHSTVANRFAYGRAAAKAPFAKGLKDFVHTWFEIPNRLLYGTQEDKLVVFPHMVWEKQLNPPEDKTGPMSVREILQHWGDLLRKLDVDAHVKVWRRHIDKLEREGCPLALVPDVRHPNEVAAILQCPRSAVFWIQRPSVEKASETWRDHVSEKGLSAYEWSQDPRLAVISNDETLGVFYERVVTTFETLFGF